MIRSKYIAPFNNPPRDLDDVSLTIPDQALSVRQILERYAVGATLDASHYVGSFDNDADFDDFTPSESPDFDLADIQGERDALARMHVARESGQSEEESGVPSDKDTRDLSDKETRDSSKEAPTGREKPAT